MNAGKYRHLFDGCCRVGYGSGGLLGGLWPNLCDECRAPFLFVNVCSDICNFLHKLTRMVRSSIGKP